VASRILERLRAKVRSRDYVMTVHAEEEMDEDDLSIFDVESAVLTGKIVEQQRDRRGTIGRSLNLAVDSVTGLV